MKKLLVLALAILSLSACQMTEEITFNEDGSGMYDFKMDMGAMMKMGKGMENSKDSLAEKKAPKVKDTIIQFSDLLEKMQDSLNNLTPEEKESFKYLKKMSLRLQMDESKDEMLLSYILPFKDVSELENILNDINKIEKKRRGTSGEMKGMDKVIPKSKVRYSFNKHSFKRTSILNEKNNKKQEQDSTFKNNDLKQIFQMLSYKIIYHFPKKIKSVSYKDALLSADAKTLHIEVPMDKMIKNPKLLDFEVIFE